MARLDKLHRAAPIDIFTPAHAIACSHRPQSLLDRAAAAFAAFAIFKHHLLAVMRHH